MTKLLRRIGVGILSLSMVLTSLSWSMTLVASAAEEDTTQILKLRAVDEEGNPVQGLQFNLEDEFAYEILSLGSTDANGELSYSCANDFPAKYNLKLVANEKAVYDGKDTVTISENVSFERFIGAVNDKAYNGEAFVVTVKTPKVTSATVLEKSVSPEGGLVTVKVTGKNLKETLYVKKYYCALNSYGEEYRDFTYNSSEGLVPVKSTGSSTERIFTLNLPAADKDGMFAWKLGVATDNASNANVIKTSEIAIDGIEKPEATTVTSVTIDKKMISPEGDKIVVTVKGTGLPDKLGCLLVAVGYQYAFDDYVVAEGDTTRLKTFELDVPEAALWKDTDTWRVGVQTRKNGGYYFSDKVRVGYYDLTAVGDRISGTTRYDTAIQAAETFKKVNVLEKLDAVIIANGDNYPDALAGGYLAKVKNAPIILVTKSNEAMIRDYVKKNLVENGKVYLLGGTGAVSKGLEDALKASYGNGVVRLGGQTRYDTNLAILEEAGVGGQDLLICTGTNYADSLSASSVGKPILLVGTSLTDAQKAFLVEIYPDKITAIGGTAVVSDKLMNDIANTFEYKPEISRIAGKTRYETSVAVAKAFFGDKLDSVMLAVGTNFPDGLAGGPLASLIGAPIILVTNANYKDAKDFCNKAGVTKSIALGGTAVISEKVRKAMVAVINIK